MFTRPGPSKQKVIKRKSDDEKGGVHEVSSHESHANPDEQNEDSSVTQRGTLIISPRCHHNLHELPMDFGQEANDLATGMLLSTKIGKDFSKNYDRRGMRGREGL